MREGGEEEAGGDEFEVGVAEEFEAFVGGVGGDVGGEVAEDAEVGEGCETEGGSGDWGERWQGGLRGLW